MYKLNSVLIAIAVIGLTACQSSSNGGGKAELKTFNDSVSFALGYYIAYNNDDQGWEPVDQSIMAQAMQHFFEEGDSNMPFTREEAIGMLNENGRRVLEAKREKNAEEGEKYMEENKTREGVISLESGLQYKIVKAGDGAMPTEDDVVRFHYTGKFTDGEIFDSSMDRGQPLEMPITRLIRGWREALLMMPVGSKWELVVPPNLGYGPNGSEIIPPAATLVFDIELLEIVPQEDENETTDNP